MLDLVFESSCLDGLHVAMIGSTSYAVKWVGHPFNCSGITWMWTIYIHHILFNIGVDLLVGLVCGHLCIGVVSLG